MNALEVIRAFAGHRISQTCSSINDAAIGIECNLAALKALAQSSEWLTDRSLVERVVVRLENMDMRGPDARAQAVAIYMKLIGQNYRQGTILWNTTRIIISDQKTVDLPTKILTAESCVFRRLLSDHSSRSINLCGKASKETLANLATHLATGESGFVSDENAIELFLLAKEYGLYELAMKCMECLLAANSCGLDNDVSGRQMSDEEVELRQLLAQAKAFYISITRSSDGIAFVTLSDGSKQEQWDCLTKLHDYIPISHLELSASKDVNCLLNFCKQNPGISSLKLGNSPGVGDKYLEELSHHLPKLHTFSICSASITTIPQSICNQLNTLECFHCPFLTSIHVDRALTLKCSCCDDLKSIYAPRAVMIDCSYCYALTSISAECAETLDCKLGYQLTSLHAPNVITLDCSQCHLLPSLCVDLAVTLDCRSCYALISLSAPSAVRLICSYCRNLGSINADQAVILDCSNCPALPSISAPRVKTLTCGDCYALTSIDAKAVVTLRAWFCPVLTSIDAPHATSVECGGSASLTSIIAPCAVILDCVSCLSLTSLRADSALTLYCGSCTALTSLSADSVIALSCGNCPGLSSAAKRQLLKIARRNIILTKYKKPEKLIELLNELLVMDETTFLEDSATEFPLKQWFIDVKQFNVPADFVSVAEKSECVEKITDFFEKLTSFAANESALHGSDFRWFDDLKRVDSPQQQMSRVAWVGSVLACVVPGENPFADPKALQMLKAIGNLGDAFVQERATRALFSLYEAEATDPTDVWMPLMNGRSGHLLLLCLFFTHVKIHIDIASELLDGLNTRHYMDFRTLNPILEMCCLLSLDHSLVVSEREILMQIVLKAPKKESRENAKQFAVRKAAYKAEQPKWVNACRDLLLFGRASELKNVQQGEDILSRHKSACQAVFGVKDELLYSFIDSFKSKRYPNGLFTYAARLQLLSENERDPLTAMLGKFVNGLLEGAFPANRYDLSNNRHLSIVFEDNPPLLEKWKKPLEIDLGDLENLRQDPEVTPREIVVGLMRLAIDNRHLGVDQQTLYPTLVSAIDSDDQMGISMIVSALEKDLNDMQGQCGFSPLDNQTRVGDKLHHLQIEILCLKVLDPHASVNVRDNLCALFEMLVEESEFKRDVLGMLKVLTPSKSSRAKWVKLQTSESWEDLLLMGTEVNNSCQRIDGDPNLNKCLLAYILDGKNQLMIIRDSDGRIAARSVLRILWNGERHHPVLFMEQIYTATADPALPSLVKQGCMEKAKMMGIPLVASPSSFPQGPPYKGQLCSFGGPAPFEYVDALRGIQEDGSFTISTSNIIYLPIDKPAT